ncbi:MAG: hydrogenase expression/formation protein HypE [Magnetococcales bacterium]|nr:hydrogenase expression/formation protein HypE [Magnetococcales bacterium]
MDEERRVLLAHGGGGRLSRELVEREIVPRFGREALQGLPDAATLRLAATEIRFTTDCFVVHPLFFPGGCIGDLAVHGTINDLAVSGGQPLYLSLGMILEEGLPWASLRRVLDAIRRAALACNVAIVTGDTKVVRHGQCDGIYLAMAGLGAGLPGFALAPASIRPGDVILVSGTLGDHGMAVLAAREKLFAGTPLSSDTGPVHRLVEAIAPWANRVRFMRDPTRGGIAATLHEAATVHGFALDESALPFHPAAATIADLLGISLLHSPSEGRILAVTAPEAETEILNAWRALPEGKGACRIGRVEGPAGRVTVRTVIGGQTFLEMPHGEMLPRIC